MKTQVDGYNIDLREVIAIGPLRVSRGALDGRMDNHYGCSVWMFNRGDPFWLKMAEGEIDPYQIDDSKNAYIRTTANIAYSNLVMQWQGVT